MTAHDPNTVGHKSNTSRFVPICITGLCAFLLAGSAPGETGRDAQAAKPGSSDAARRADALIASMTLEEKAGQLSQMFGFMGEQSLAQPIREGRLGSVIYVNDPATINRLQRIAVEQSRLKIPLLFAHDVDHGYRTIFPVPLALAATFDPEIVEKAQSIAATEARAAGIHWTFAPMVDIARDPRWGRIVEGNGEDPYLGATMARAHVRGFQGDALGTAGRIIAGPKHFVGYGASPGGRDYESVYISDAELHNVYLPPFAAAIDAGAGNIMAAFVDLVCPQTM